MHGPAVILLVLLLMALAIKLERGQLIQLRVMVELHVFRLMEVKLNLAVQNVRVRQITYPKDISYYSMSTLSVNCQWSSWDAWADCATECALADGSGDRTRTRTSTAEQNGGTACVASDGSDTQSCSVECPGKTKYMGKSDNSFSQCQSVIAKN